MAGGPKPQKIPLIFYRTRSGSEPVRELLKGLDEAERQGIGKDLLRAQWRWPVGMPLCRPPSMNAARSSKWRGAPPHPTTSRLIVRVVSIKKLQYNPRENP